MTALDIAQEAVDAYPKSVFPEFSDKQLQEIGKLLKENGYDLSQLSAHNMRYRALLTCKKIWELKKMTDPDIKALGNRINNLEQGLIMYASVLYENKLLNADLIVSLPKYMRHRIVKALDMQKQDETINDPELQEWSKL